jgi:hypothetical protein
MSGWGEPKITPSRSLTLAILPFQGRVGVRDINVAPLLM